MREIRCLISDIDHYLEEGQRAKQQLDAEEAKIIDAMTALQIRDRADLSPADIVSAFERAAPRSVRARRRMPALLRRMPMKVDPPFNNDGWRLGYLMDVIYNRDAWMHRVDVTRAIGREMVLTPDHDGRLVSDAVAEWARRHGQPFRLTLTGPAGGEYVAGNGDEHIELDAVELCRILSGRAQGSGLLSTEVPF